jgi:hypothetical protein
VAIIGSTFVDLIDIYKGQDANGQIAPVIEILNEMMPILDDAIAVECNKGTTHLHTVRSGLPTVAWGKLYQGIPNSKSGKAQVEDTTGFVEALSTIDTRVLALSGNEGATRLSEAVAHIEAISQEVTTKIFYGNSASDPEEFMGLSPRFNDKSAANGNQIIDAGGTGSDNTSVWFIAWGDNQTQLLYPKGTQAGVTRKDMGEQRIVEGNGAYFAKEEMFTWNIGLAVKDWRYVVRIANIDVSALQADPTNIDGANGSIYKYMRKAFYRLQSRTVPGGKLAIYCNRDVLEALDAMGTNSGSNDVFSRLSVQEIQGKEVETYRKIPIRETDALLNTEARVV